MQVDRKAQKTVTKDAIINGGTARPAEINNNASFRRIVFFNSIKRRDNKTIGKRNGTKRSCNTAKFKFTCKILRNTVWIV